MEVVNSSVVQNDNKENITPTSPVLSPSTKSSSNGVSNKKKTAKWKRARLPLRDITHLFNSPQAQSTAPIPSLPGYQSVDLAASDSNPRKRKVTENDDFEDAAADSLKHRQISRTLRMGFR